jgi:hypothetical protein
MQRPSEETMDHHEQHHQHHQKEREERIKREEERERITEELPRRIHPAWFIVAGVVLIGLIIMTWTLVVP